MIILLARFENIPDDYCGVAHLSCKNNIEGMEPVRFLES
jgi:hypothetical protein